MRPQTFNQVANCNTLYLYTVPCIFQHQFKPILPAISNDGSSASITPSSQNETTISQHQQLDDASTSRINNSEHCEGFLQAPSSTYDSRFKGKTLVNDNSHKQEQHCRPKRPVKGQYYICPVCHADFKGRPTIKKHLSRDHCNICLEKQNLTFNSVMEFDIWRTTIERDTGSHFIVLSKRFCKSVKKLEYVCHQSSPINLNCIFKGERKGRKSMKTGLFCPALITATVSSSNVQVTYVSTHLGHECSSERPMNKPSMKDNHDTATENQNSIIIVQTQENTWNVLKSEKDEKEYEVKKLDVDSSHTCEFKCSSCDVCSHQFICNCSMSSLKLVCIHAHTVWLKLKQHQVNEKDSSDSPLFVQMDFYVEEDSRNSSEDNGL